MSVSASGQDNNRHKGCFPESLMCEAETDMSANQVGWSNHMNADRLSNDERQKGIGSSSKKFILSAVKTSEAQFEDRDEDMEEPESDSESDEAAKVIKMRAAHCGDLELTIVKPRNISALCQSNDSTRLDNHSG
jgi:TATA-binding protein-associated factor Taf7